MRRRGFTLIEMVVALLLGALLFAVMTSVLRRSFAEIKASQTDPSIGKIPMLLEQLSRDITNARQIRVGVNRFELIGFIHRDPSTLIATHRPARVLYEIRRRGSQSLLVRVQSAGAIFAETMTEPVYAGVFAMSLSSDQVGALTEYDTIGLSESDRAALTANIVTVPSILRLTLLDQQGRSIVDHVFSRQRDG
ncbi:MAG: prepilin-type N-terminal cleavage/methylation domain-containing protein [Pirellula sp.]